MGLDVICECTIDDRSAKAKAQLEGRELILRAPFRPSFLIAGMAGVRVSDDALPSEAGGGNIALALGAAAPSSAVSDALSATRYALS